MKRSIARDEWLVSISRFFCLLAVVAVPICLRLHVIETPQIVRDAYPGWSVEFDIFSWWKSRLLWLCAVGAITFLAFRRVPYSKLLGIEYRLPLTAFVLFLILSTIFSPAKEIALYGMPNFNEGAFSILAYLALFLASTQAFRDDRGIVLLRRALALLTVLLTAIAFAEYYCENFLGSPTVKKILFGNLWAMYNVNIYTYPLFATLMNSNFLGTMASILWPFFWAASSRYSLVLNLGIMFMAIGSESRGCWVSMLVSSVLVSFLLCDLSFNAVKFWARVICYGIGAMGLAWLIATGVHNPTLKTKLTFNSSGRIYIWDRTVKMLQYDDAYLIGKGPGVYGIMFPQNDPAKKATGWPDGTMVDRPHNFYLGTAYGSGMVSVFCLLYLFAAFLISAFVRCIEYPASSRYLVALLGSVIGYLVNVCFTDSWVGTAPVFWVIFGAGVGYLEKRRLWI